MKAKLYSKTEERINIWTHALGLILTILTFVPTIIKVVKKGDLLGGLAWSLYFISVAIMFLSSSLYHSMRDEKLRKIFRAIDHSVIYLTIAGSFSPVTLIGLKSSLSNVIFIVVWILAIIGILMNALAFSKGMEEKVAGLAMAIYIIMGWISVFLVYQIYKQIGVGFLIYLLVGGIFYTLGAYLYSRKDLPYNHAIFHIFIVIAAFSMFFGNYIYLS